VQRVYEDHRATFAQKGVAFEVAGLNRPVWVHGDATRLAQVVGNLLHNALKFTPRGGRAEIGMREEPSAKPVEVTVRDTGEGITPDVLPKLFLPFSQGDSTLDRKHGGLGLGLALAKAIVDMHGGTVRAASGGSGAGATFIVELPVADAAGVPPVASPPRTAHAARRILIIEDNPDTAQSFADMLTLLGHTVAVARDGRTGVARARQFRPEVVLCDIGLEGMSGYEVAATFRSDEALRDATMIAVTGYALPADVERAKTSGFDAHLAKPPKLDDVTRLLAGAATPRGS
jgi:two-component system, chemotaxis family, CheB/CheR fusion protein